MCGEDKDGCVSMNGSPSSHFFSMPRQERALPDFKLVVLLKETTFFGLLLMSSLPTPRSHRKAGWSSGSPASWPMTNVQITFLWDHSLPRYDSLLEDEPEKYVGLEVLRSSSDHLCTLRALETILEEMSYKITTRINLIIRVRWANQEWMKAVGLRLWWQNWEDSHHHQLFYLALLQYLCQGCLYSLSLLWAVSPVL